jgi:hypothetical protein
VSALEPEDVPPELQHARIPDDARELDPDRLAYYRELASRGRAQRPARRAAARPGWSLPRRPEAGARPTLSGPMMLGVLVMLALMASLMVVLAPRPEPSPVPLPLAETTVPVGEAGGLLPEATVVLAGRDRPLRDARPVVLATVPAAGCDQECEDALASVWRQATQFRVRVALVGPPAAQEALEEVARTAMSGSPVLLDPSGAVADAYAPVGTTVIPVHADGVVAGVYRDVAPGTRLDAVIGTLGQPGNADPGTGSSVDQGR